MKCSTVKPLLTAPLLLIIMIFSSFTLLNYLKINQWGEQLKPNSSTYSNTQVAMLTWEVAAARKGRTEECTWLGINCN